MAADKNAPGASTDFNSASHLGSNQGDGDEKKLESNNSEIVKNPSNQIASLHNLLTYLSQSAPHSEEFYVRS